MVASKIGELIDYATPTAQWVECDRGEGWVIGSTFIRGRSDWDEHDVAMVHLYGTLGFPWARQQQALPSAERHIAIRWYWLYERWLRTWLGAGTTPAKLPPVTGAVTELVMLAYDLYYLRHAEALPSALVDRLRLKDQFQGARYEIALAGSLARLGFKIVWQSGNGKHHDFDAHCPESGERFAVEAKSRHVPGVLHTDGVRDPGDDEQFKGHRQYQQAVEQCPPDRPSVVCLDLNVPHGDINGPHLLAIARQSHKMLDHLGRADNTSPEALLVLTNFSWHYDECGPFVQPAIEYVGTARTRKNFTHIETVAGLTRALHDRSEPRFLGRLASATPPPKGSRAYGRTGKRLREFQSRASSSDH